MKNKVLIFIDWFAPGFKAGGPITSNVNLTEHLKDAFDFYVITSSYDYHSEEPYDGIPQDQWVDRDGVKVWYFSKEFLSYANIKKVAKDVHCDVWYINGIYSRYFSILPLFAAKDLRPIKVIVSSRGMLSPQGFNSIKKRFFIALMKMIGVYKNVEFHTTNDEESKYAQNVLSKDIKVTAIENLPRKQDVKNITEKHKLDDCIRLVSFARISDEKNTLFAINALSLCKKKVQYDIYGQINSFEYWDKCQQAIKLLPDNVKAHYRGAVNPSEMPSLYANYDMLHMPSRGENYGHAILESFINGCPVIISDKTPWRNLEDKKIGWDKPLEESLFSQIIDKAAIMTDEEYMFMSKSAFEFGKQVLNDTAVKSKYIELFQIR